MLCVLFFKQKTAYEMRISDWSSDVCSSDLVADLADVGFGDTALTYTAGALEAPSASRLSLSLPVRAEQYPAVGPGGRWVRSLLPEGRALAWAVQHFGIPEDDRYALIGELGSDVAGAVEVLPEGAGSSEGGHYEPLSGDELASLVGRAHTVGLGLDRSRGVRLSLAGMQDKLLLHEHAPGQFSLPVRGAASTVIVTPEPPEADAARPGVAGVATHAPFRLTLAPECGLHTAPPPLARLGAVAAVGVVRYDRDMRSEMRLVGEGRVRTCRSRGTPEQQKKKPKN